MIRFLFAMVAVALASYVGAGEAAAQKRKKVEYTYDTSPDDGLYRAVSDSVYTYMKATELPEETTCEYGVVVERVAKKYLKKNKLPKDLELKYSACHFRAENICETSSYSGEEKCYNGEATIMPDVFRLSKDGNSVEAKMLMVFYNYEGRVDGRVIQIFKYTYYGSLSEDGTWAIDRKSFKGMLDL